LFVITLTLLQLTENVRKMSAKTHAPGLPAVFLQIKTRLSPTPRNHQRNPLGLKNI
jgi:hypothetical protein